MVQQRTFWIHFWSSAGPPLGCYFLPLQNKVPSCPPSLPITPPRRHYKSPPQSPDFVISNHRLRQHKDNTPTTDLHFLHSTFKTQWLAVKAKVLAAKVVVQRIRHRRVRNHTAQRLAYRFVYPLLRITFFLSTRPLFRDRLLDLPGFIIWRAGATSRVQQTSKCAEARLSRSSTCQNDDRCVFAFTAFHEEAPLSTCSKQAIQNR